MKIEYDNLYLEAARANIEHSITTGSQGEHMARCLAMMPGHQGAVNRVIELLSAQYELEIEKLNAVHRDDLIANAQEMRELREQIEQLVSNESWNL